MSHKYSYTCPTRQQQSRAARGRAQITTQCAQVVASGCGRSPVRAAPLLGPFAAGCVGPPSRTQVPIQCRWQFVPLLAVPFLVVPIWLCLCMILCFRVLQVLSSGQETRSPCLLRCRRASLLSRCERCLQIPETPESLRIRQGFSVADSAQLARWGSGPV